ncbi:hypothetical protein ACSBR2_011574 [Camellia fascicularis]
MAQEEHNHRCSNSSSGGGGNRSSKKLKQKKVPQRGLGVAQLEKIRLEEKEKKDALLLSNIVKTIKCSGLGGGLDHNRFACRSTLNLPYESNPILPPPNIIQRTLQFQLQNSSSSMVNVSSGTSLSSEIKYHQMEPPSNQSFYGNNCTPLWHEEEKMVGMKRPYPFPPDNPPGPLFPLQISTHLCCFHN